LEYIFSLHLPLSETVLIRSKIQRDLITKVLCSPQKGPHIILGFQ